MGRQLSGADDWGLTRQGPAVGFAKRTARVLRTRNSPVTFPRGGVVSRPGRSSTYPRLSPATPWAYKGDTPVSHESGVCASGSRQAGGLAPRSGGSYRPPDPGALWPLLHPVVASRLNISPAMALPFFPCQT
jgi:hypothetical protein